MRLWLAVCALLLFVPCAASAQASRDEAIRLLLAGDYQKAAQALRPLAEDPSTPDSSAQFLLALLYDFGTGVPRNVPRACGLYRQAAGANGPFMGIAALLRQMLQEDSPIPEQLCSPGPWHDQPEASFTLAPDHSVQYTANAIVVRYRGEERRIGTGTFPGMIPLPVIYTPLDVTNPVNERRHFFQSFVWSPDNAAAPAEWELIWGLSEVVGTELVAVTFVRNLLNTTGAKPPANLDLRSLAHIRVGAGGEPEWATTGPNARSAIVPRRERK